MTQAHRQFLIQSAILVSVTALLFVGASLIGSRLRATAEQLSVREGQRTLEQTQAQFLARERARLGPALDELPTLLPTEAELPDFFGYLETLASRYEVSVAYDFTNQATDDPRLAEAAATPGQWVIAVDFLGPRSALEAVAATLEHGAYILNFHTYKFDVQSADASQLSVLAILYGQGN